MANTKIVRISEEVYERLKSWAVPLEDSVSRVIERVLDIADEKTTEVYGLPYPRNQVLKAIKAVLEEEGIRDSGLAELLAESIQRGAANTFGSARSSPEGPYLSLAEAATEIGLSASTLRQQVRAGRLKGTKIGRAWVTTPEWLSEYHRNIQRSRKEL